MNIRCICKDVGVKELVELAKQKNWDIEQIKNNTGCGNQCGLCVPYISYLQSVEKEKENKK
jgi:bacterioferritin-associated ferredoxin